ncbi:hypothetical protein JTS96_04710 [Clostridium botulinum]|nr:hypothetical protein [Clostridium botulinum]
MRKPRTAEVTAYLQSDIKSVWNVVTNNNDYKWRSDIEKLKLLMMEKNLLSILLVELLQNFLLLKRKSIANINLVWEIKCLLVLDWTFFRNKNGGTKIVL